MEITFVPRTVIKAQALGDFLAKHSFSDTRVNSEEEFKSEKADIWSIKVDNSKGVRIRMVITSPHRKYEGYQSIKLDSSLSNNQAEYEALIIGMTWALATGIQALRAYSDSQVAVRQVNNEFTVHSKNLKAYGERATSLKTKF